MYYNPCKAVCGGGGGDTGHTSEEFTKLREASCGLFVELMSQHKSSELHATSMWCRQQHSITGTKRCWSLRRVGWPKWKHGTQERDKLRFVLPGRVVPLSVEISAHSKRGALSAFTRGIKCFQKAFLFCYYVSLNGLHIHAWHRNILHTENEMCTAEPL
jgi:hypothetical protein